jgi:hypothetical protein
MSTQPRDSVFDLVCYLLSSARLSIDEAPRYGSVRMLVAASRLLASEAGSDVDDPLLAEWKSSIDQNMFKVMDEYPEYLTWLGELTREVAEEATSRNMA